MAMDAQTRQKALDDISPEDLAKIKQYQAGTSFKVDDLWLVVAEFTRAFGWQAYEAFKEDSITLKEMMTLLTANRKLDARDSYMQAQGAFVGVVSANSKTPSKTFKSMTRKILKETEVDK